MTSRSRSRCLLRYIMEKFLRIGVITRPHGVHGEVKIYPTTDYPQRFEEVENVIIRTGGGEKQARIENVRYFKNLAIVKFDCFDCPEQVQKIAGADVYIERSQAQPLEEGEYYIADLIGCRVYADDSSDKLAGELLGTVKDVLQTGANDVYVVETGEKKTLLFPVIADCVKKVDIENSIITVHVMKGLLDL